MSDKDGGQAFPHGDPTNGGDVGMSLRDYFAAAVLPGLYPEWFNKESQAAKKAYDMADAMIAARDPEPKP